MQEIEIYNAIRQEIVANIGVMYWVTVFVAVSLLVGCWVIERRTTVLSVFLPLMSLAWAASILRFDYLIHRQGAYLAAIEKNLAEHGIYIQMWEAWKSEHLAGVFIIPMTDVIIFLLIIIPTAYVLFTHTQEYFRERKWRFGRVYSRSILILIVFFLALIPFLKTKILA